MHLLCIGGGPANLSLAALYEGLPTVLRDTISLSVYDRQELIRWHRGQMFPGTTMQNEFYRDLVTPVSPSSSFGFLCFLKAHGRLTTFINTGTLLVDREEFEQYLNWVASSLPNVRTGCGITSLRLGKSPGQLLATSLDVAGTAVDHVANRISIGVGQENYLPAGIAESARVIHVSRAMMRLDGVKFRRVAVIGSGQSAAEFVYHLLGLAPDHELELVWLTRDSSFRILDTGHFTREVYSGQFLSEQSLSTMGERVSLGESLKYVGHGISPWTLDALVKTLYRQVHITKRLRFTARSHRELVEAKDGGTGNHGVVLSANNRISNVCEEYEVDLAVLCTGYRSRSIGELEFLADDLRTMIDQTDAVVNECGLIYYDFSGCRIYVNGQVPGQSVLGEENYVVAPFRAAAIINDCAGYEAIRLDRSDRFVELR